jgi:hypothetical protein
MCLAQKWGIGRVVCSNGRDVLLFLTLNVGQGWRWCWRSWCLCQLTCNTAHTSLRCLPGLLAWKMSRVKLGEDEGTLGRPGDAMQQRHSGDDGGCVNVNGQQRTDGRVGRE